MVGHGEVTYPNKEWRPSQAVAADGEALAADRLVAAADIQLANPWRSSYATCRRWSRSGSPRITLPSTNGETPKAVTATFRPTSA